jgi:hypothetical protein
VRQPEQQACPSRILISNGSKVLGPPADNTNQAALWKTSQGLTGEHMPTDDQNNSRSTPFDWTGVQAPVADRPDRATYEAARRAELDHIRRLDVTYRQLLNYRCPERIPRNDDLRDRDDLSREERDKAVHELYRSRRVLVCVIEVYLLGCVEYPDLTGEAALGRAISTDSLISILQAEEDLMITTYGPPWVERPFILSRSHLQGLQSHRAERVPSSGAATAGIPTTLGWPWR